MIPLGTYNNPTRRRPYLTYGLMLINVLVFLWETSLPPAELSQAFYQLSIVPCQFIHSFAPAQVVDFFRGMFLHADFWHLIGNMVFLWIFATNVEDFFGRRWFLILYFAGGLVAALVHTILYHYVCLPLIGASGAISAVLGAYIVLYPGTRVRVGFPFFRFFMLPLTLPAYLVLGLWFIIQVFNGTAALNSTSGGVAFFAHIGGFVFGLALAFFYTMVRGAPETTIYPD
ncbi:MAG: rhomboid family intramembrane serine protease [Anaerolineae bacterium]|nr:rhomboid family intramembrane serine protease [Anaerolineae bacterium]